MSKVVYWLQDLGFYIQARVCSIGEDPYNRDFEKVEEPLWSGIACINRIGRQ